MRCGERIVETVDPTAHDRFDRTIKSGAIDNGSFALAAADDEMDADQRAFREKRIERAHMTLEDRGEIVADPGPDLAVVAIAWNVDQHRHEAIEAVAPRQHPHPGAFVEPQNCQREVIQRVLIDLKQFVARIILQYVDERLAGMA